MTSYSIEPIGVVESPFKQKFGVPRQPRLTQVQSVIRLHDEYSNIDAFEGVELHSHLWVLFLFHQHSEKAWKPTVRPPRMGGNESLGVFATRSSFRPNSIGMSAVRLVEINHFNGQVQITVEGLDVVDGTPIVDIKPYIPYSDSIPDAHSDLAKEQPPIINVMFAEKAETKLLHFIESERLPNNVQIEIEQILGQDPRPQYRKNKPDNKVYAVELYSVDIMWKVENNIVTVVDIEEK